MTTKEIKQLKEKQDFNFKQKKLKRAEIHICYMDEYGDIQYLVLPYKSFAEYNLTKEKEIFNYEDIKGNKKYIKFDDIMSWAVKWQ